MSSSSMPTLSMPAVSPGSHSPKASSASTSSSMAESYPPCGGGRHDGGRGNRCWSTQSERSWREEKAAPSLHGCTETQHTQARVHDRRLLRSTRCYICRQCNKGTHSPVAFALPPFCLQPPPSPHLGHAGLAPLVHGEAHDESPLVLRVELDAAPTLQAGIRGGMWRGKEGPQTQTRTRARWSSTLDLTLPPFCRQTSGAGCRLHCQASTRGREGPLSTALPLLCMNPAGREVG